MIYFDNAATTQPTEESLSIFNKISAERYFNPSASYSLSFNLYKEINLLRQNFIELLDGKVEDKLIFTSGATESNNLAIFGMATNKQKKYLFSIGEHPSVYNCACELKNRGYNVEFIPLQTNGEVDYNKFKEQCTNDVCFVSTMLVSNETGAINDIKRIRQIIDGNTNGAVLHVDAVQGFGKINFSVSKLKIDLCSLSAHKIGGIKGVGALYVSKQLKLKNINYGGEQEFGLRSGTVNAPGIFSFYEAAKCATRNIGANYDKVSELKNYLIDQLNQLNSSKFLIPSTKNSSPYIVSIICNGNRGETIMRFLDSKGICVGTGSACSSNKIGNRILENMGYTKKQVMGAIRISFNPNNCKDEINVLLKALKEYFEVINT